MAAFILDNLEDIFDDALFSGIYRDDGIIVKEGIITKQEIAEWKNHVNERVEELVRSDHLKFTVDIWDAGGVGLVSYEPGRGDRRHSNIIPY